MRLVFIFVIMYLFSCSNKEKSSDIIAELENNYLYKKDITPFFEGNNRMMSEEDSINKVRGIINQWALRKIFFKKAQQNLSDEGIIDIEKLVSRYREDLIINEYQNLLITQEFNEDKTSQNEDNLYKYYQNNKSLFKLNSSIIKFNYIVVPKNFGSKKRVIEILKNDTLSEALIYEIESLCYGITQNYSLKDSIWKNLTDVEKIVSIKSKDILKGKVMEVEDKRYIWLIKVNDFRNEGSEAPFDYIRNKIKNVIYNQAKLEFMKNIEKDLLENSTKNGKFKVY